MIRRPPRSTRTDTLFPYTTLFRSLGIGGIQRQGDADLGQPLRGGLQPRQHAAGGLDIAVPQQAVGAAGIVLGGEAAAELAPDLLFIPEREVAVDPGAPQGIEGFAFLAFAGQSLALAQQAEARGRRRSEEHTSELQSLMRISY